MFHNPIHVKPVSRRSRASRCGSFAIVLALLSGDGLTGDVSAASADPAGAGSAPAVDVPVPEILGSVEEIRRGGQAARIEFNDDSLDNSMSAWYRLAYVNGGSRLQVFEHYEISTLGPGSEIEMSQRTAWRVANEVVGQYGASTTSQLPSWARARTGNNTGPSAGLMFALSYIDLLTRGALVGDLRVAGTGGIGPDGVVIPMAGIETKVAVALLAGPDVIFTTRPSKLVGHTTIVDSQHSRIPDAGFTVGEWLNVAGYEQAGRDAAGHPGDVAFVVVHDIRQVLAWLCGRTNNADTCNIAQRSANLPVGTQ